MQQFANMVANRSNRNQVVFAGGAVLAMGCWLLASRASAHSSYVSLVPNGNVSSCKTCHNSSSGGSRNVFGSAFKSSGQDWTALFAADADGDGQTNGQELGDPCGTWTKGKTPARTNNVSNPGVATSTSATPATPTCAGGSPPRDAGTPPSQTSSPDSSTPAVPPTSGGTDASVPQNRGSDAGQGYSPPVSSTSYPTACSVTVVSGGVESWVVPAVAFAGLIGRRLRRRSRGARPRSL